MAFNPDHSRRMRKAFEGSGRVVQIGVQSASSLAFTKARELATPERMGVITALHTHHYRNAPYGGWMREIPPDCDTRHLDWKAFEGEAALHPLLLRLCAQPQRTQLPLRNRIPLCYHLPDGHYFVPPRPHRALGQEAPGYRLGTE
jgi:hypothetical protein